MEQKIDKTRILTWYVTGASSGVGYVLCKHLLSEGYNVVAVARHVPNFKEENCLCLSVDVTKPDEIKESINYAILRFGRIDVLSINAGISANVTLEEETIQHMREVMEVNFFGAFNTINLFIPHFRNNNNGTIIINSSQSGISCRAFGSAYVSSKHALEGLASVCWHECKQFCRVMIVELGYFKGTGIYKSSINKKTSIKEYQKVKSFYIPFKRNFENNLEIAISFILKEVEKENLPRRLMLGKDALIQIGAEISSIKHDLRASKSKALSCSKLISKNIIEIIKWNLFK